MADENSPADLHTLSTNNSIACHSTSIVNVIHQPPCQSAKNDNIETIDPVRTLNTHITSNSSPHDGSTSNDRQLVIAQVGNEQHKRIYWPGKSHFLVFSNSDDDEDQIETKSLIDHAWQRKILELVGNKTKLMESFSWLSTVGGGYSALGESDQQYSSRAGALSLGQQLRLAELLGDERLRVMCHLFAALAALQMNNRNFCINYIRRVIVPLIQAMPYRDRLITNILRHICFRLSRLTGSRLHNAVEATRKISSEGTSKDLSPR